MLPAAFRTRSALRVANTLAVGASLAALTGSAFGVFAHNDAIEQVAIVAALSTLFFGSAWAVLLRKRSKTKRWRAWLWCIPLAALNAAVTCGALFAAESRHGSLTRFFLGAALGATYGGIIWIPALLATLALFGIPLARAQRLAERGLAGEEQGEYIVGLVCAVLGTVAGGLNASAQTLAQALFVSLGSAGALSGVIATWLASARARRRRAFVAEAEAGLVRGYRVDVVPEGKVLVRVDSSGEVYRGAERFEAVFELAPDGSAKRPLGTTD
ncbi:MAG: hypothetical protein WCJ30_05550 [Deltaproteobacteria bacterium]